MSKTCVLTDAERWQLVRENKEYYERVAKKITTDPYIVEELVSEATLMAYRASSSFDPARGNSFKTLLGNLFYIELLCYKTQHFGSNIYMPANVAKLIYAYNNMQKGREDYETVSAEEFAESEGITLKQARNVIAIATCGIKNTEYKEGNECKGDCSCDNDHSEVAEDGGDAEERENAYCDADADDMEADDCPCYTVDTTKLEGELLEKQLDAYLRKYLTGRDVEKKIDIFKRGIGFYGNIESNEVLASKYGVRSDAMRQMVKRTIAQAMAHMPLGLKEELKEHLGY